MNPEPIASVSSPAELQEVLQGLKAAQPDLQFYFRGQCHQFIPTPSAQRELGDPEAVTRHSILQSNWDIAASYLLSRYALTGDDFFRVLGSMAVLQHYGFRSWFVDVSSDPQIACWFALQRYVSENILFQPALVFQGEGTSPYRCDHALAAVLTARYERSSEQGYVFVYGVPKDSLDVFQLDEIFGPEALRVHRQKAGVLIPPIDGTDINSNLIAKICVMPTYPLDIALSTNWLFPPASEDDVYRSLQRVPFVLDGHEPPHHGQVAWPDLVQLPIYFEDELPINDLYRNVKVVSDLYGGPDGCEEDRSVVLMPMSQRPRSTYSTSMELPTPRDAPANIAHVVLRQRKDPEAPLDYSV